MENVAALCRTQRGVYDISPSDWECYFHLIISGKWFLWKVRVPLSLHQVQMRTGWISSCQSNLGQGSFAFPWSPRDLSFCFCFSFLFPNSFLLSFLPKSERSLAMESIFFRLGLFSSWELFLLRSLYREAMVYLMNIWVCHKLFPFCTKIYFLWNSRCSFT